MFKKYIYSHDWIISAMVLLILLIGLITIYSTSIGINETDFHRQLIFALVGLFLYFLISLLDYSYLQYKPVVITLYIIDSLLLLLEFIAGHTVRGATRWLSVGLVNLQPSEITKVILIIALASFFSYTAYKRGWVTFLLSLTITAPLGLLVFIEPSLSAASVLIFVSIGMYLFANQHQKQLLSIVGVILIAINIGGEFFQPHMLIPNIKGISLLILLISAGVYLIFLFAKLIPLRVLLLTILIGILIGFSSRYILWNKILKPYQKERVTAFTMQNLTDAQIASLDTQTQAALFQVKQSKIAIGSGEVFGKGFAQGTQSKLDFLPDHNTDFVFASFSEEFGLLGDSILLILFAILYFRMASIAERIENKFGFFMMCGIIILLIFQTFVNIAINIGMLPATGIPMPLVSYGGSSLWVTLILLGLVQSIYRQNRSKKWLNIDI